MKSIANKIGQCKPLRYMFLSDGTPVHSINDIPKEENYVFVSISPIFKGFRNVLRSKSQMINRNGTSVQESSLGSTAYK